MAEKIRQRRFQGEKDKAFTLRMPKKLWEFYEKHAGKVGRSVGDVICEYLDQVAEELELAEERSRKK